MMRVTPYLTLGILLGLLWGADSPAIADDGFYLGMDLGMTVSPDMKIATGGEDDWSGTPESGRCDRTVNPAGVQTETVPCADDPRPWGPMFETFDGAVGIMTGAVAGYRWRMFRVEAEYVYRNTNVRSIAVPTTATYDPRNETQLAFVRDRVDNVSGHHGFFNVYYDHALTDRWTPYIGVGVGVAQVDIHYSTAWVRSDDPADIQVFDPSTPEGLALNTKLAGTCSCDRTIMQDTLLGYQVLAGLDYRLTEQITMGLKARWVDLNQFRDEDPYSLLRSHASVAGNPPRPVTYYIATNDVDFFGLTLAIKYAF